MPGIMQGVSRKVARPANRVGTFLARLTTYDIQKKIDQITAVDKGMQILLSMKYREMHHLGMPLPRFDEVEFRAYSQNGEDGILLYIFALIGTTNKKCVEMCVEEGIECNTANLIINHGWSGLLFDGDAQKIAFGRDYYARNADTCFKPPALVTAWIDRDNVNTLIRQHGVEGEIDLFSLDMDGVDYWILEALTVVTPRVIVLEFSGALGPDVAVTVPYRADFRFSEQDPQYRSASLAAYTKLLQRKGYRLVGCQRYGFNAFFVREGIGEDVLPERSPREVYARLDWSERSLADLQKYSWQQV